MQLLSMWTFGLAAILTILFFGAAYPIGRQVRRFLAWANGTEPPKEKMVVFWPLSVIIGIIAGGFVQTFYTVGSACNEAHQPVVVCTMRNLDYRPK